jgi:hypothetical protein
MSSNPYLGANVSPASSNELHQRGLLEEGETLLALFDGTLLDENRRRVGGIALSDYVALTNQRLLLWARGFFSDAVDGFAWSDVDVVKAETWDPWHGRVVLAFRLPAVEPRRRRIEVGGAVETGQPERVITNTLDYMPADDVNIMAQMVGWVGDQLMQGVDSVTLIDAFAAEFPAVEHQPRTNPLMMMPSIAMPQAEEPLPMPEPAAPPAKKPWWKFGESNDSREVSTGDLIADYERRRPGGAEPAAAASMPMMPGMPGMPGGAEQPSVYEITRSLRLFLEAPRKIVGGLRRAREVVGGANELMGNMQDPQVRRTALRGVYQAAAQQEMHGGPLARVGPLVRAAVRLTEPTEPQAGTEQPAQRRVAVRAAVRRPAPERIAAEIDEGQALSVPPSITTTEAAAATPARRSITVRRAEAAPAETSAAESHIPQRRISVVRSIPVNRVSGAGHETAEQQD